ncbi:MAG: hypothetical protein HYY17_00105 [Planctomycetes bacterium]|nr:hypothetical protein [Planctomycetota bacterium]
MNKWMSGLGAALMASLVWFPLTSTTQDPKAASIEKAPKELAGLRWEAKVEFPEKAPNARLVVEISNPGGTAVKKTFKLVLQETNINPMARMMPTPRAVWTKEFTVEVEAGKDTRIAFDDAHFNGWSEKKDPKEIRETLREIVLYCGDQQVRLLGTGSRFGVLEIK